MRAIHTAHHCTEIHCVRAFWRRVKVRIASIRAKHNFGRLGGPFMHLKTCETDGATLRTGSANFSGSGENAQDNDPIVIRDGGGSADAFEGQFERMWRVAQPMIEFGLAINAQEPR
jgi:phosphatidylserine/phosphatidylglycerophosphate/cardiolipin synthase-like enzyme